MPRQLDRVVESKISSQRLTKRVTCELSTEDGTTNVLDIIHSSSYRADGLTVSPLI